MSEQTPFALPFDLYQVPVSSAACRNKHRRHLESGTLYLVAGTMEFLQILGAAAILPRISGPLSTELSVARLIGLSLLVELVLLTIRRLAFPVIMKDGTVQVARRAAVSVFLSILSLCVIDWCLPRNTFFLIHHAAWIMKWALLSSTLSAIIWFTAIRIAETMRCGRRVAVVGETLLAKQLADVLADPAKPEWSLVGRVDDRTADGMTKLVEAVDAGAVDLVAVAIDSIAAPQRIAAICSRLADRPVPLSLGLDLMTLTGGLRNLGSLDRFEFVNLRSLPCGTYGGAIKRAFDILVAGMIALLLLPLVFLISIAIRIESPGPVFFEQWRFGLSSRPIRVIKFRTMYSALGDPTGEKSTQVNDPRVTRVGRILRRLSLDEIPQILNVLRGDMSLVGPRPHPMHMRVCGRYYFELLEEYRGRHIMRPGITGWAQVNGSRGQVDTISKAKHRLEFDLWYIDNWSLWLDLKILLMTVAEVLKLSGD